MQKGSCDFESIVFAAWNLSVADAARRKKEILVDCDGLTSVFKGFLHDGPDSISLCPRAHFANGVHTPEML
jgi:hypothetical protein